ncbi:uncharacterized protein LOC116543310 isoform X2 [Sapajus apella]|uniref:Uncharacterized protein LOC116543310 isoform X2 n=1 Tax=Sapajus apella TaxID=9515 RepID=A0A6J3H396_SAPAP|nr:uncharacterized protein LOC116543310 isoform X2 [Sapajus apella]
MFWKHPERERRPGLFFRPGTLGLAASPSFSSRPVPIRPHLILASSRPLGPALRPGLLPAAGFGVGDARLQLGPRSSYFPPLSWVPVAESPHPPLAAPRPRGVMTHFLSPADIIVPPPWPGSGGCLRPPRPPPCPSRREGAGAAWRGASPQSGSAGARRALPGLLGRPRHRPGRRGGRDRDWPRPHFSQPRPRSPAGGLGVRAFTVTDGETESRALTKAVQPPLRSGGQEFRTLGSRPVVSHRPEVLIYPHPMAVWGPMESPARVPPESFQSFP